jgi:beta-lactamase superfamily II metal-dependent hydrolase
MFKVLFFNVGQGDSIVLEWEENGISYLGIIDCKNNNGLNPVLDFLVANPKHIVKFIVLSHFHDDHFSGYSELFNYCLNANRGTEYFIHTIQPVTGQIYNKIFTSQKLQNAVKNFILSLDAFDPLINNVVMAQVGHAPINLTSSVKLLIHAPTGKTYHTLTKQISRKVNVKPATRADINQLATILEISNEGKFILLTSDAIKKGFRNLSNKLNVGQCVLAQAPHHGSNYNLREKFWEKLNRVDACPIVFSVGDEPQDKLPDFYTVDFFRKEGYDIHSTNCVYGINQVFSCGISKSSSLSLGAFSRLRSSSILGTGVSKYSGDQIFQVFNQP